MLLVLLGDWDFVVCDCSICEKVCGENWRGGEKGNELRNKSFVGLSSTGFINLVKTYSSRYIFANFMHHVWLFSILLVDLN